ncbi:MAG: hypothetical protein DYH08_06450 [Actinobacteria bacterium ATB1]|nr:hypothetical protein [Actinobacteria bacterium ATB1]
MGKASTLTVRSVTAEDDLLWERGLSKSAQGTWMQRLAYLRAVGRHLGDHFVSHPRVTITM